MRGECPELAHPSVLNELLRMLWYNGKQKIKNPHEGGASPCSSIGGKLASHNNPVFTHKAPTLNKSHEWVLSKLSNQH